jgi:hypothetical protein
MSFSLHGIVALLVAEDRPPLLRMMQVIYCYSRRKLSGTPSTENETPSIEWARVLDYVGDTISI